MTLQTINGIKIHVKTFFREDLSRLDEGSFFYNYEVFIENTSEYDVQLISRYWKVEHLLSGYEEVKGEGVVGVQPVIRSRDNYSYISGCEILNSVGKMSGFYNFKNLNTNQFVTVPIPSFSLTFPPLSN